MAGGAGGGLFLNNHDLDLSGLLADNIGGSSADGAGLYGVGTVVALTDAEVRGHAGVDGAGLFLYAGARLTLLRTTLSNNHATGNGGAVFLEGPLTAEDSTFDGNSAAGAGGGAWVDGGAVGLDGATFEWNDAGTADAGGGIVVREGAIEAIATTFLGNTGGYGAGVALLGSGTEDHDLRQLSFADNVGAADGGGLFVTDARTLLIAASLFSGNTAAVSGGGASMNDVATLTLRHTDWLDNVADVGGGLSAIGLGGGRTVHNDFAGNRATDRGRCELRRPLGPPPHRQLPLLRECRARGPDLRRQRREAAHHAHRRVGQHWRGRGHHVLLPWHRCGRASRPSTGAAASRLTQAPPPA